MKDYAEIFKALGDPTRLAIVEKIMKDGEVCACKLLEIVKCNQPTLSHHMKLLVDTEIIIARKDWKWVHYSINQKLIEQLKKFFDYEVK